MSNISTDKAVVSTNKSTNSYSSAQKMIAKSNSDSSSNFESILNQQVSNSSATTATNHPKIASTGVSDSAPKEYRDRVLAGMEYAINHGHTDSMELTENGYMPKSYSAAEISSPEGRAMIKGWEDYAQTPEGQKSHLMFGNAAVKAIVKDKDGNIVAKFYADNTTGVDPQKITNAAWDGVDGSLSTNESISQLEKRSDLTVIRYSDSQKVTDLDLLRYEVSHAKEQIKQNPEFQDTYNKMAKAMHPEMTQNVEDVLVFQESILAA